MKTRIIYLALMAMCNITIAQPPVGPVVSYAGGTYLIKSRSSQRCLDFISQNEAPGAAVRLRVPDWTTGQKFTFENAGDSYYYIRIRSNNGRFYLTLDYDGLVLNGGGQAAGTYKLTQKELYAPNPVEPHTAWSKSGSQKWKIKPASDKSCVLISNKNASTKVLTVNSANTIGYSLNTSSNNEQWILKAASMKENPKSADAEIGIVPTCIYTAHALFGLVSQNLPDLSLTLPEWRAVGDNITPTGPDYHPRFAYEVLEGIVTTAHVSDVDAPNTHYTHDFDFNVYPDPAFRYLTANRNGTIEREIPVEWETGIGQSADRNNIEINPADAANRRGDSYGFFTAGHKRQPPNGIWNWPTVNDWVHVEGPWIWDRGHPPAKTEIHPTWFVAIQRNLPDKYSTSGGGNYFYATRCDLFASGDGGAMMNNRGLKPYVEPVKMSLRNYVVIFKHTIPKLPNSNAQLTYSFKRQPGDNFPANVKVEVFGDGSADLPNEPHVRVTIPWATSHVSDNAVFARSLFLYWNDAPTNGKDPAFKIRAIRVSIDSIYVFSKEEGNDPDPGEFRMFADIGGKWFFLNEYIGVTDILSKGLGATLPTFTVMNGPPIVVINHPAKFKINQSVEIYLPANKNFRCFVRGWEDDYIGYHFGEIFSPYASCEEAKDFIDQRLGGSGARHADEQGKEDDPLGIVEVTVRYSEELGGVRSIPPQFSRGVRNSDGVMGTSNIYKAIFRI
ncbi:MAG: RICIN domain-containing protein, partial [Sediminibacterium sp.]